MPVNTTVGTKNTNILAVAAKANGRSDTTRQQHLSKVSLAPQCSYVAVARHPKDRSQYLDSCETKYNACFRSSLMYYQSAVLDVSSCTTRFPSTRVRIPARQRRSSTRLRNGHTPFCANVPPQPCKITTQSCISCPTRRYMIA